MQITKQLRTETGHRLTNYSGRCAHLHGHSYLWEVTAKSADGAELDAKGMVMDFKDLKKAMNTVLDPLDHCMVLAPNDPLWKLMAYKNHPEGGCSDIDLREALRATNGQMPRLIGWHENPTAESFAAWALEQIQDRLLTAWQERLCDEHKDAPMPYSITSVKVWETATSYAEALVGD